MKIKVNTKELEAAIKKLDIVRPNKTKDLQILETIKIEADSNNNSITLTACDLHNTLEIKLLDGEIIEAGEGILSNVANIKKSFKFFKESYTDIVDVNNYIHVLNGKKEVKNVTHDPKEFPKNVELENIVTYTYNTQKLYNRLVKVAPAICKDEVRPILTGVHFNESDILALDGYRLHLNKDSMLEVEKPFTVAGNTLTVFQKLIGKKDNYNIDMVVDHDKRIFQLQYDVVTLTGRLLDGEFINYKQILPKEFATEIKVALYDFKENVEFIGAYAEDKNKLTKLTVSEEIIEAKTLNETGEYTSNIEVIGYKGKEQNTIGVNNSYLLDALKVIEFGEVNIGLVSELSPIILKDDTGNELYLILPIRLKDRKEESAA